MHYFVVALLGFFVFMGYLDKETCNCPKLEYPENYFIIETTEVENCLTTEREIVVTRKVKTSRIEEKNS